MEQSSYEDDLQILRVIEAYCFSKQRQTMTNSGESCTVTQFNMFDSNKRLLTSNTKSSVNMPSISAAMAALYTSGDTGTH